MGHDVFPQTLLLCQSSAAALLNRWVIMRPTEYGAVVVGVAEASLNMFPIRIVTLACCKECCKADSGCLAFLRRWQILWYRALLNALEHFLRAGPGLLSGGVAKSRRVRAKKGDLRKEWQV